MTLEEIITTRRSVRSYTDEPVSKEEVLKLLDMARWAPCASECWRFVAVTETDGKGLLAKAARQDFIATAPVIIVVGADTEAFAEKGSVWHRWDAYKFRGLFYIQDTAAAIQNLMLAAAAEGLGTCWIGSFNEGDTSRIVQFPSQVRPVAMVPLGRPADEPPKRTRRPLEEVAFWETLERDG